MSSMFSQIPGIRFGFGHKTALMPESLHPFRASMPEKKQVHGTRICDVTEAGEHCGDADALYTRHPGILLTVLTADCLPVLFSRRDGQRIAVAHAGWRGLIDGILERTAACIARDDDLAHWHAIIGPAAAPCCYEVDEALYARFCQELPYAQSLIAPRPRYLDLAAIARAKLLEMGFASAETTGQCTICTPESDSAAANHFRYTSFRRNTHRRERDPSHPGIKGRNQYSGLVILP